MGEQAHGSEMVCDPSRYIDKAEFEWMPLFYRDRLRRTAGLLSDAIIEEHRANPLGGFVKPFSLQLQEVMDFCESHHISGRQYKIFGDVNEDGMTFHVMVQGAEGLPTVLAEPVFSTFEDVLHEVFERRCADLAAAASEGDGDQA